MILEKIIRYKKKFVLSLKRNKSFSVLKKEVLALPKKRPAFLKALRKNGPVAVIAEIKRKSPSKGILRKNFDPVALAKGFERSGAAALSVLTDEKFFGGSEKILRNIRAAVGLPILRKDFILEEYQIWESRRIGADAVLLIAAILSEKEITAFSRTARNLGLDVLLEVHTPEDAQKAKRAKAKLVGINNRDLNTFHVDLSVTRKIAGRFPKPVFLVSESGIQSRKDLIYLRACGARAVLVGETLMRQKNPASALKKLLGLNKQSDQKASDARRTLATAEAYREVRRTRERRVQRSR